MRDHHEHSPRELLEDPRLDAMNDVKMPLQQAGGLQEPLLAHVAFFLVLLLHVLAEVVGVEKFLVADVAFNLMDLAQVPLQLSCQGELPAAFRTLLSSMDVPDVLLQMRFSHVHVQAPAVLAKFSTNSAWYVFQFSFF